MLRSLKLIRTSCPILHRKFEPGSSTNRFIRAQPLAQLPPISRITFGQHRAIMSDATTKPEQTAAPAVQKDGATAGVADVAAPAAVGGAEGTEGEKKPSKKGGELG